jgi:thiol-disulfide isomerase/thioredoxin
MVEYMKRRLLIYGGMVVLVMMVFGFAGGIAGGGGANAMRGVRALGGEEYPTLAIGAAAPDFSLRGVDGKVYSLASFKDAKVLVIIFMCNHCPTSQAYEGRIIKMTSDYADKGVRVVGINPNSPGSLRLDELGYSDVGDSYEEMKVRARDAGFNFPYLYDGETEAASKRYGPVSTPHVFIFDGARRLRYNGRFDDMEDPARAPHHMDARNAIDALLSGQSVAVATTPVFGCSIKWAAKKDWIKKAEISWAKEPVNLAPIDLAGMKELVKNKSQHLKLINFWATWCVPCVNEFPELVTLHRMYRDRGFELVSISMDDTTARAAALAFLQKRQASSPNYIFTGEDKYALIGAMDTTWRGALPFTMLVEPGGKVVYSRQGLIDGEEMKKIIFNDRFMGRIYK